MRPRRRDLAVVAGSYLAGAIPFSGIAARLVAGVDLRETGTGTVSGTGLYEVAGVRPMVAAGVLDLAKGAMGPLIAGPERPGLGALAAAAAIAGHNWSPFLSGAGGRGVSPALGATLVLAPEGAVILGAGLGIGRLLKATGLGCLVALAALFPVLGRRRGRDGLAVAAAVAVPLLAKRVVGNGWPEGGWSARVVVCRLLYDRDSGEIPGENGPVESAPVQTPGVASR